MNAKLIHPVKVELQNVDTSATQYNSILDEQVGEVQYKSKFSINAQVKFFKGRDVNSLANGFELIGDGYLLVYKVDADKIEINAKIISVEGEPYELYVKSITMMAAYDNSKFRKVMFESKNKGAR